MYQRNFWRGAIKRTNSREDGVRENPEAKPMAGGPGEFDTDMATGSDSPKLGSSQPRATPVSRNDELPMKSAGKSSHKQRRQLHQVLMAHALRMHFGDGRIGPDGTTMGTAVGGGAAGGGAG